MTRAAEEEEDMEEEDLVATGTEDSEVDAVVMKTEEVTEVAHEGGTVDSEAEKASLRRLLMLPSQMSEESLVRLVCLLCV